MGNSLLNDQSGRTFLDHHVYLVTGDNPPPWRQLPGDNPLPKIPPEVLPDPRVLVSLRVRNMGYCQFSDNSPPRGSVRVRVRLNTPRRRSVRVRTPSRGGYLRGYFRYGGCLRGALSPGGLSSIIMYTSACKRPVVGAHQMRCVDPATFTTLPVEAQPSSCTSSNRNLMNTITMSIDQELEYLY